MSFTEIFEWMRAHYIISLIAIWILVCLIYHPIKNHQIKTETRKIAHLAQQWWQLPVEQGGYGKQPLVHTVSLRFKPGEVILFGAEYNAVWSDISNTVTTYIVDNIDSPNYVKALSTIGSKNGGSYNVFGIEDDDHSILLAGVASNRLLLYVTKFYTKVTLSDGKPDVNIKMKQMFIPLPQKTKK